MKAKKWTVILFTLVGIILILAYLNFAVGLVQLTERVALFLAFALGPAAILGMLQIHRRMSPRCKGWLLDAAIVFLIIGFTMLNLMLVVQQSIFISMRKYIAEAADEATKHTLQLIFKSVNWVQLGIDVSLDIFYCLGVILLGAAMCRYSKLGMVLGVSGMVVAAGLLILNMSSFPVPPAEAGLVDLGPVTGVWWLAVITAGLIERRARASFANSAE
jgi:hypothetical protein